MRQLLLAIFLLSSAILKAQNMYVVDSLNSVLESKVDDTVKIMVLGSLAYEWQNNNPTKSLAFAQQALQLAQEINYPKGIAEGNHRTGNVYFTLGKYSRAMDYYYKALNIRTELRDSLQMASTLNNIGICNQYQGDMVAAKRYLEASLNIRKRLGSSYQAYLGYTNLANWYIIMSQYDSAIHYLEIANQYPLDESHRLGKSFVTMKMGEAYMLKGEVDKALEKFQFSFPKYLQLKDNINGSAAAILISKAYQQKGLLDSAIWYANRAYEMGEEIESLMIRKNASEQLYQLFAEKKDFQNAYKYQRLMRISNDSLNNVANLRNIEAIRVDFELAEREKELGQRETKIREQRVTIFYFAIGLLILVTMIVALFLNQKKVGAINKILEDQRDALRKKDIENTRQRREISEINSMLEELVEKRTKELEMSLEHLTEKSRDVEHFSYVLSHKVRSHVARIMGLINLLSHTKEDSRKEIIGFVDRAAKDLDGVLRDMDQVFHLQQGKKSMEIAEINLKSLLEILIAKYKPEAKDVSGDISLRFSGNETVLTDQDYLYNIMENLVSNALKYRNPEKALKIELSVENTDSHFEIKVKDNGLGMDMSMISEDKLFRLFQRHHNHQHGRGLGLYLVKMQAQALGGNIQVESERLKGTTFTLKFPLEKDQIKTLALS